MTNYKTAAEALQSCLEVWNKLAETCGRSKEQVYDALGKPRDAFSCAACEFAGRSFAANTDKHCRKCVIWDCSDGTNYKCENMDSPYKAWACATTSSGRQAAARNMVALIEQKIKENQE